jgi:hypothetical protein
MYQLIVAFVACSMKEQINRMAGVLVETLPPTNQDCTGWARPLPLGSEPAVNPLLPIPAKRMLTLLDAWGLCRFTSKQDESVLNMCRKEAKRDRALDKRKPKAQPKGQSGALAAARLGLANAERNLSMLRSQVDGAKGAHVKWLQNMIKSEESKAKRLGRKVYAIERDLFRPGRRSNRRSRVRS